MAGNRASGRMGLSSRLLLTVATVGLPLAAMGCGGHYHEHGYYRERVYVDVTPPDDRIEVIPVRPSADHIWIPGHHIWRGGVYVWVGGHYELAPRHNAEFVRGHWERENGRYFWVEGHWR